MGKQLNKQRMGATGIHPKKKVEKLPQGEGRRGKEKAEKKN